MEHAVYERGWAVELAPGASGAEVLAHVVPPYFNRDHLHFSSHAQTPPAVSPGAPLPAGALPAAVRAGRVVYLSFPSAGPTGATAAGSTALWCATRSTSCCPSAW